MAAVTSTMLELGTRAPDFSLADTDGRIVSRIEFAGNPLLVMFICNHCPYVKHIADELAKIGREYQTKGVGVVAIMSNDVDNFPDDSPANMAREKESRQYTFPYLYDDTQVVAKAYFAACTPDFYLFDADHKLAYRGQLDDSRPNIATPVTGADLRDALNTILVGKRASQNQKPSMGCNIKWRADHAPDYA